MSKQITLQDIYTVVNRLEDKVEQRLTKVETKVDVLENVATKTLTIFGIIGTVGTIVFTWVWNKIIRT